MFDKRLKQLREAKGLTQKELSGRLGLPQRTYSSYENNEREPGSEMLKKICGYFGVTVDYMLGLDTAGYAAFPEKEAQHIKKYRALDAHGIKIVDLVLDEEYSRCSDVREEIQEAVVPKIKISYSFIPASAGSGSFLDEQNIETREFPDTPESRQADIVIPVDGDSMMPMFHDGDELYVRLQPAVEIGEIGIFEQGDRAYVKKFAPDRLISINPDYDDIYPDECNVTKCIGKVIGKVTQ